ncbi:FG-GAP-like repeat-containing protein [Oligoflexia bacterium]|nr:FG-GAP-like repeat-containing protein [Oligoflexia bacterium]
MATLDDANSIAIADFDGNGVQDIVTSDYYSDSVSIFEGNGDGTFQAYNTFAAGQTVGGVAAADFDGDGKQDVVASNRDDNTISILLGNGDGTLKAQTTYATGLNPLRPSIADFNGDGVPDMVVPNGDEDSIGVFIGNGDGSFQARVDHTVTTGLAFATALSDLNGDGVTDITATNGAAGAQTSILLGNGVSSGGSGDTSAITAPNLPAFGLYTQNQALAALPVLRQTLDAISAGRGSIGTLQARLGVGIKNLAVRVENFSAAESRIIDADIATETATLVKSQILQQVGATVLAQANQMPALAIELLS